MFAQEITEFWRRTFLSGGVLRRDDSFTVAVNPDLSDENRVMVLEATDGQTMVVLTPALADRLDLARRPDLTAPAFRRILDEASVTLHGADYVFYFPEADRSSLLRDEPTGDLRQLTARDEAVFAAFEDGASEHWTTGRCLVLSTRTAWSVPPACTPGRMRRSPTPASSRSHPPGGQGPRAQRRSRDQQACL